VPDVTQPRLAIHGGPKVRTKPWPVRGLFGREEKRAVAALFDTAIRTGRAFGYDGDEEQAYCREFAEFMGGGYADAVSSGTSAVYVALRALGIEPFTEVIVPPVTDAGGVMPVPLINCIPVPSDSAPGSFNMGPQQVEKRITKRTSAIIVAHIAGLPVDMAPIMEIARAKRIPVIEDCAQAHGAKYRGKPVGAWGDIAAFSTMSGKHHATGAQGGVVFTKNKDLYWRSRQASDRGKPFGADRGDTNVLCSLNLNLNDLSASIGRVQLRKLPQMIEARRRTAATIARGCRSLRAIRMVEALPRCKAVYWFLFFRLDLDRITVDKKTFVNALTAEGLPMRESYLRVFTDAEWYKKRAVFGTSGYPWTSPLYTGNPDREYPLPNVRAADACHFGLSFHESCGDAEAADALAAFRKVERAFVK